MNTGPCWKITVAAIAIIVMRDKSFNKLEQSHNEVLWNYFDSLDI